MPRFWHKEFQKFCSLIQYCLKYNYRFESVQKESSRDQNFKIYTATFPMPNIYYYFSVKYEE